MSNVNKLNTLVAEVFGEHVENVEEIWHNDADVQKAVKALCVTKSNSGGRKKDPNAPKRGKSAYLFFCAEHRDGVKADLGEEAKATDVTKELGVRWNALKASKKAADKKALADYEKSAAEDKSRYESEKADYVPPSDDEEDAKPKRRGGKKKSAKKGPKRAKSSYLFFCAQHRDRVKADNPEMKATEVTAELGRLWNELKENEDRADELAVFEEQAAADKARYEAEKAEAGEDAPAAKPKKAPAKGKKAPAKGKKAPAKGKKKAPEPEEEEELIEEEEVEEPAPDNSSSKAKGKKSSGKKQNSYQAFCAERRPGLKEEFPKAKASEITKKLSAAWKALSKDEQEKWKVSTASA